MCCCAQSGATPKSTLLPTGVCWAVCTDFMACIVRCLFVLHSWTSAERVHPASVNRITLGQLYGSQRQPTRSWAISRGPRHSYACLPGKTASCQRVLKTPTVGPKTPNPSKVHNGGCPQWKQLMYVQTGESFRRYGSSPVGLALLQLRPRQSLPADLSGTERASSSVRLKRKPGSTSFNHFRLRRFIAPSVS